MKFNWGQGLVIANAVFTAGVFIMVSISISKDVDLVTPNYYDKEIKYQEEINRINNTNKLITPVNFEINESTIVISFPNNTPQSVINGEILFYRPSGSKKDFIVKAETDINFKQSINISSIEKGLWKIKIMWSMDGIDYLSETSFIKQ
ncbi:MAG TPA: FixH family protein [Ignavibacteria bacterium]|nr:FixH family protein [Ignavibacteria bacterium]